MIESLAALGFGFVSALLPVANAEVYMGVVAARVSTPLALVAAAALSVGQTAGKIVWYVVARRSTESAWVQKKLQRPKVRRGFDRWSERLRSRPGVAALVLLSSAFLGLPPLLVLAVVAGSVRIPLPLFVVTVLVGRLGRFVAMALSADWVLQLL